MLYSPFQILLIKCDQLRFTILNHNDLHLKIKKIIIEEQKLLSEEGVERSGERGIEGGVSSTSSTSYQAANRRDGSNKKYGSTNN